MILEYKIFFGIVFLFTISGYFLSIHYCGVLEKNNKKDRALVFGFLALLFAFLSAYTSFFFVYSLLS